MKRIYFIIMAVVAVMATGCKNNKFLDLTDPDSFDGSKFYRDSADMEGLLSSAYQAIRPAYDKLFFVTEMKSEKRLPLRAKRLRNTCQARRTSVKRKSTQPTITTKSA